MKTTHPIKQLWARDTRRHARANVSLLKKALEDLPDADDLDFEGLPDRITARPLYDLDIDLAGADAPTYDLPGRFHS